MAPSRALVPPSLLTGAFKDKVGDVVGPVSAQNSQFVCQIAQKIPADMSQFAKSKDDIVRDITQQRSTLQQPLFRDSVVAELKRRGKVKIYQDALNKLMGSLES